MLTLKYYFKVHFKTEIKIWFDKFSFNQAFKICIFHFPVVWVGRRSDRLLMLQIRSP